MIPWKQFAASLAVFVLLSPFPAGWGQLGSASAREGEGQPTERKIIVFEEDLSDEERDQALGAIRHKRVKRLYRAISADVLEGLDARELEELRSHPKVKRVDNDVTVWTLARDGARPGSHGKNGSVSAQAQVLPWGIDRIDAELVWPGGNTADPIKVGIIDTGISKDHPDLKANIKGGVNTIRSGASWNDDNGHGSHVAGIAGALNNSFGVVGAAPAMDFYAIKVLSASGSGFLSDVIEGIDWAIANGMGAINMSLGTSADVQSFHDAVIRARSAGIVQVAAAGNNGGSVIFPAAYPEVMAVSATDQSNAIASFSSRGPEVDLAAPGVKIFSTYKGKNYATLSGTSMAAPHVTGSAALVLNIPVGSYDANANSKWDPDEVQQKLQDRAQDLGSAGRDDLYGWGLVNAFAAVQP